jgi:hypothetical protein
MGEKDSMTGEVIVVEEVSRAIITVGRSPITQGE